MSKDFAEAGEPSKPNERRQVPLLSISLICRWLIGSSLLQSEKSEDEGAEEMVRKLRRPSSPGH